MIPPRWLANLLTLSVTYRTGEWRLIRCRPHNGQRRWRIWRNHHGAGWAIATERTLIGTLIAAWKNRGHYPHDLYR